MSDLSRLLGDVYGDGPLPEDHDDPDSVTEAPDESPGGDTTEVAAVPAAPPPAPAAERPADASLDWADESALDEAFATWVPGPSADAPAAERRMMGEQVAETDADAAAVASDAPPPSAEWPFDESQPGAGFVPPVTEEPERARPWSRSDDDILPVRGRRRRR